MKLTIILLRWSRSKRQRRLLPWRAPVTAAVAHDAQRVERVLYFSTGQRSCTSGTWHCATSRASNTGFIPPDLWPPNSPDLNPVDYKIWGVVQERVYQSRVHSIDELKQCLLHVWHGMDHSIIDSAVDQWHLRLRACVRANGGHYEHLLWHYRYACLYNYVTWNVLCCVKLWYDF